MTGVIEPDIMGIEGGGFAIGLSGLDDEIKQLENLRADTDKGGGADKADMLKWIDERLAGFRGTRKKLAEAKDKPGTYSVLTQGSYVARTNRARGGPLTLVSWFTRDADGTYHANLLDHSQLVRAEDFHLKASGTKYEAVMERLFFELTKTYPDGSMTFAFQVYDGVTPTDRFVRFERKTDTVLNDIRDVLFSQEVSTAVSILSVLMMLFPPTAAAGVVLGLVYNTAQALDAYAEAERTGTLKAEHPLQLALAALSVIPAARAAGFVRIGARTFRVINIVEKAGDVLLLAESAEGEITNLRNSRSAISLAFMPTSSACGVRTRPIRSSPSSSTGRTSCATTSAAPRRPCSCRWARTCCCRWRRRRRSRPTRRAVAGSCAPTTSTRRGGRASTIRTRPPAAPSRAPRSATRCCPEGLPPHLRDRVVVVRDEGIHDNTVRVHYDVKDGHVGTVTIKAGRSATPDDVRLHARTAELMVAYSGLMYNVKLLLDRVKRFFTGAAAPPPVGSRAWEAMLELDKLPRVIEARLRALEQGTDAATAAKLRGEIEVLGEQLARHQDTFDRLDLEAGKGFVAAEADHHTKAVAAGYPPLDKAKGHYYEPDGKGGYTLRQRADSPDKPMEVVEEGGRRSLREGSREQIPGLALDQKQLRNVLEVMSAGQASALADTFGSAAINNLAKEGAAGLKNALRAYERLLPLTGDPVARRGIERIVRSGMNIEKVLKSINGVPESNLRNLLRVLGDEKWTKHPQQMGPDGIAALGKKTDTLHFIERFGMDAYKELNKSRPNRKVFNELLEVLKNLDDVDAAAKVKEVLDARTPVKREKALDMPDRPPPRRASRYARADKTEAGNWSHYEKEAREFFTKPPDGAKRRALLAPDTDLDAAIEARATIEQMRERYSVRWERFQELSYEARRKILDDIDDIGRSGGLYTTWVTNARGAIAERLFAPGGGLNQRQIPNPLHPHIDKTGKATPGFTRLDGSYPPGKRPETELNVREWVELKSDEISLPGKNGQPNAAAVAIARGYAREGKQDWDALKANYSTRGDELVIHFTKKPDDVTLEAMKKVLFAPDSPFVAVCFGDKWHNRPAGRALPPLPPSLEAGPTVGVPIAAGGGP